MFSNEVLVADGVTTLGRIVFTKAVFDFITNDGVNSVDVSGSPKVSGTGYVVGETFDIVVAGSPGVELYTAKGVVTSILGGGSPETSPIGQVTGVKIISSGAYVNAKQSPEIQTTGLATSNASAGGNDDLLVDITFLEAQWTEDRGNGLNSPVPATDYVDDQTDFEWICTSIKAANPATIGMTTETDSGNDAARLMVASGYNSGATFDAQPDVSPSVTTQKVYLNIPGQNPEIFISITERRVNIVARDGNNVQYGGLGLFIPLTNVDASYPFPAIVHGQSVLIRAMTESWSNNGNGGANAGITHPATFISYYPPCWYRDNLSTAWLNIAETSSDSGANAMMWPNIQNNQSYDLTHAPQVDSKPTNPMTNPRGILTDVQAAAGGWFQNAGQAIGVQGVAPFGTGQQMSFVCTAHIIRSRNGEAQVIGYIDGFENVHGVGLTAFEEIESYQSASRYLVFPDTNTSTVQDWVAMEII